MQTSLIKNEKGHEKALARIEKIFDAEPGTPKGDEFELLTTLVELYEKEKFPIGMPSPVEAVKFRMDQQDLTRRDLIPHIGSKSKVSEVLSGKRQLTLSMIRALNQNLGIPAEVLLQEPKAELPQDLAGTDWEKFPLAAMAKLEWIDKAKNLKDCAEETMRGLINQAGGSRAIPAGLFRQGAMGRLNTKNDQYALRAWCVYLLARAEETKTPAKYKPGLVTLKFLKSVVKLSVFKKGPKLAQEHLAQHGIRLLYIPHLPQTYLDGAALLMEDGTPVIGLTLRYDRLDNFWFTLLHELAHVGRHLDKNRDEFFIDDLGLRNEQNKDDKKELEADEWAENASIPKAVWAKFEWGLKGKNEDIRSFAEKLGISPAIVAGRVRFEKNNYHLLSHFVGAGEVRKHFS